MASASALPTPHQSASHQNHRKSPQSSAATSTGVHAAACPMNRDATICPAQRGGPNDPRTVLVLTARTSLPLVGAVLPRSAGAMFALPAPAVEAADLLRRS